MTAPPGAAQTPADVLVLYNRPQSAPGDPDHASEAGVLSSVAAVLEALSGGGYRARSLGLGSNVDELVREVSGDRRPELVFNLCESFAGDAGLEPAVAGLLDLLGLPYTGSPAACLALARDKAGAKRLLAGAGLPTPEFRFVGPGAPLEAGVPAAWLQRGPLIVKPAAEDASLGLSQASVVRDVHALEREVAAARARWKGVLVERFLPGREFSVGLMAAPETTALPVSEIDYRPSALPWNLVTYAAKWDEHSEDWRATPVQCPADLPDELARALQALAVEAFDLLGCRDYARVDLRLDEHGAPHVLEVNPNPDLDPRAGFARALDAAGHGWSEFVCALAGAARARGLSRTPPAPRPSPRSVSRATGDVRLRELEASDLEALVEILTLTGFFRPMEVTVGREVLVDALAAGPKGHYQVRVAEQGGLPIAWAAYGLSPMTDRSWDLYWIAVHPSQQARGIGALLLEDCERRVAARGGRWLLAETSGMERYLPTRAFYVRRGYSVLGTIPDFYVPGDGRVTFGKRLESGSPAPAR
jgi:D-alanine-D-alanine ligase